jgi:hypothetical protein
LTRKIPDCIEGLKGRCCGFGPLIALTSSRSCRSLLFGVGGQDAKNDRKILVDGNLLQPAGTLTSDMLEMWRITTHNGAQAHHCVKLLTCGQAPRSER